MTTAAPAPTSTTPRPVTAIASGIGLIVAVLCLPVVLLLGGPLNGWILGVVLWSANWWLQLLTAQARASTRRRRRPSGMSGISFISRAWLTAIILFVIALKYDEQIGLTAAGVFLVAFTCDLAGRTALFAMNQREHEGHAPMSVRRLWGSACALALGVLLLAPSLATAASEDFDPSVEFETDPYVKIELGPLDLSINKAVIYLLLAAAICIGVGIFVIRGGLKMRPTGAQNVVELVYEFAEQQIARPTLSEKVFSRYFPFIATLFMFLAVSNLISFIPLPVSHESGTFPFGIPDLEPLRRDGQHQRHPRADDRGLHRLQLRGRQGPRRRSGYLKTLVPSAPAAIKPFIFALELLSQVLRLVSLSVRLFANLLAGHLLIIMCAGFMVLLGNFAGLIAIPVGVFFYIFEWVLIAGLQAFIFAMLSGIYIGFAVESSH